MRRLVPLFSALLLATLLFVPAFAATEEGKITLNSDLTEPVRGQTFSMTLEMNRNPGVASLRMALRYDPGVLELIRADDKKLLPNFSQDASVEGKSVFHWKVESGGGNAADKGVLVNLTFRIKPDATFGDSRVTVEINEELFDATNKAGQNVFFDIDPFDFTLVCAHYTTDTAVTSPPSFTQAGVGETTCRDCGEKWETPVLPEIASEDGKTHATVQTGEFTEGEKSLRTEFYFGGATAEEAKRLFGDSVIRVFGLTFTREGTAFVPVGETRIRMKTEFEKPENFGLYLVTSAGPVKVDAAWADGEISFLYGEGFFVLVKREVQSPVPVPSQTPGISAPEPTLPPATLSPEEIEKEKEIRSILIAVVAFVLCGVGAIAVLRRKKPL